MKYTTNSEKETFKVARDFAKKLKGGEVLALVGDLGAGKTAFTKGIAKGMGVKNIITSPTFVLMKVYSVANSQSYIVNSKKIKNKTISHKPRAIRQLVHIDAYRLTSGEELEMIGVGEYLNSKDCVTIIEWADRVKDILPKNRILIEFKIGQKDKRIITIK